MIFALGEKENTAIAALLMDFILKNKAKRGIFIGQISRQNGIGIKFRWSIIKNKDSIASSFHIFCPQD